MTSRDGTIRFVASIVGCVATLAGLTACGGGSADPASTGAVTTDTAAATTTFAEATTTTVLATTTTEPPVVFTLRRDGLGPFDFASDTETVIAAVTEQFGPPTSDNTREYPEPTPGGYFTNGWIFNADGSVATGQTFNFVANFGRETCWALGLCLSFGGVDSSSTSFVGWRYEGDAAATLMTDLGLTLGSRLSDHPEIGEVYPCWNGSTAPVLYDGLGQIGEVQPSFDVVFFSEGIPFTEISGAVGSSPGPLPPAEQTIVKRLRAGETPHSVDHYCG